MISSNLLCKKLSKRSPLHAGQKLIDKELCYLKTVIVTAYVSTLHNATDQVSNKSLEHLLPNPSFLLNRRWIYTAANLI